MHPGQLDQPALPDAQGSDRAIGDRTDAAGVDGATDRVAQGGAVGATGDELAPRVVAGGSGLGSEGDVLAHGQGGAQLGALERATEAEPGSGGRRQPGGV